jgi:hypothetical protein
MSMYWSPSLYYKDPQDGVLSIVKTSHTHYYVVIGDGYIRKVTSSTCSLKFRYIMGDNNDRTQASETIVRHGTVS